MLLEKKSKIKKQKKIKNMIKYKKINIGEELRYVYMLF